MGRAKLNMELISKEKSRNVTFKKRKEGLMRKMHEFTTLCDVRACMIIFGPKQDAQSSAIEPEIWPKNHEDVRRIIEIYESKNKEGGIRTFGLSDFFEDRRKKAEEELEKVKKKNMEVKYPTWLEFMNCFSEVQLREFANDLSNKLEAVRLRYDFLKEDANGHKFLDQGHDQNQIFDASQVRLGHSHGYYGYNQQGLIQKGIELGVINQQASLGGGAVHYNPIGGVEYDPYHHQLHQNHQMHSMNQNSMMMLLMNEDHHHHDLMMPFGGGGGTASSSNNIHCATASFKRQAVYYETTAGVIDTGGNMMYQNAMPLTRFYAPNLQLQPNMGQGHVQHAMVPSVSLSPQLLQSSSRENEGTDVATHQPLIKNERARL